MIIAPAFVHQAPAARVRTRRGTFNFFRVSEPVTGGLPIYAIDSKLRTQA